MRSKQPSVTHLLLCLQHLGLKLLETAAELCQGLSLLVELPRLADNHQLACSKVLLGQLQLGGRHGSLHVICIAGSRELSVPRL